MIYQRMVWALNFLHKHCREIAMSEHLICSVCLNVHSVPHPCVPDNDDTFCEEVNTLDGDARGWLRVGSIKRTGVWVVGIESAAARIWLRMETLMVVMREILEKGEGGR